MKKCGLFNQIKKKEGFLNEKNIKIYNNSAPGYPLNKLYKTFDCELNTQAWWSNEEEPFLMFSFVDKEIRLNGFEYSRYYTSWYPTALEVLGWNGIEWEQIYIKDSISINEESSETFTFKNEKYFSSFMFKQIMNSETAKYIEFYKFEIFGTIRKIFHKLISCKCNKVNTKPIILFVLLCS